MTMLFRISSLLMCILFLVSCGAHYTYNNVKYGTKEEALAAQSQNQQEIQKQIIPTKNKYGGNSLFLIPSLNSIMATGIKKTGKPSEEQIDYIAQFSMRAYTNMGICLDKRHIFNKVNIQDVDYTIQYAQEQKSKYDVVIYLKMLDPSQAQWMMICKPKYIERPIFMDMSTVLGTPRINSWLNNIEENLKYCAER
jgi:hypothetical protein